MRWKEESPAEAEAMGIQSLVVLIGVAAAALGVGLLTAASGASLRTAGFVAVGFVPLMWALTHLTERLTGHDVWHYSSPYPYRWMAVASLDDKPAVTRHSRAEEQHDEQHSLVEAA
jgi:hypothetical protein